MVNEKPDLGSQPNGLCYLQAGVDSAWEQKKLGARKLLENAACEAPQRPVHAVLARS